VERSSLSFTNEIDPMQMKASGHDSYPKMDLFGGYLGDGYPLCSDLSSTASLAAGAVYELEGIAAIADEAILNLTDGSPLFEALCGSASPPCTFQHRVVLPATVGCGGDECSVSASNLKIVRVDSGFYRYIAPTCINLYFFDEGRHVMNQDTPINWLNSRVCANPVTRVAGASCCNGCSSIETDSFINQGTSCENHSTNAFLSRCVLDPRWELNDFCSRRCWEEGLGYPLRNCSFGDFQQQMGCVFSGQQMTYTQAVERCATMGMNICWRQPMPGCGSAAEPDPYIWLDDLCTFNITVFSTGKVASMQNSETTANPIRVAWTDGQHPIAASPPSECVATAVSGTLECTFETHLRAVFSALPSPEELEAGLKIGAHAPEVSCAHCTGDVKSYAPSGSIDIDTVFEHNGRYYKNVEAVVAIGNYSFRNPPGFLIPGVPEERAALADVEALIDHLFTHPNTAPFISRILIQRLVTSTPSASYIAAVAEAFRTGEYDGSTFSGLYGDLAATVAAILLHPEARGSSSQPDITGQLREPIVKLMHLMRAMEYTDAEGREVVMQASDGDELVDRIGQWPYLYPRVFNFYTPDYRPVEIGPTGAYGPEFEIFTPPFMIGWFNGVLALIDTGLNNCNAGFGVNTPNCNHFPSHNGQLTYSSNKTVDETIDELSLLLTGGRLGPSAPVVRNAYDTAAQGEELKAAQKAIIMTPEFHTLGAMTAKEETRAADAAQPGGAGGDDDYKALVMLFMRGGADTFNMLVPLSCELTDEYLAARTSVGLDPNTLIPISTSGQSCSSFGLHPELPFMQTLYDDGELAFASNVGNLVEPTTLSQWEDGSAKQCSGLFSHADQVLSAQTLFCQSATAATGFGGLIGDVLTAKGYVTQSYSVAGQAVWSVGQSTPPIVIHDKNGAVYLRSFEANKDLVQNVSRQVLDNVYADTYNSKLWNGIRTMEELRLQFAANASVTTSFDQDIGLSRQLYQVARTISTRKVRGVQRDLFYVQLDGFDHHQDEELAGLATLYKHLNTALEAFVTEMKAQGEFDKVVVASGSDFGRTLTSNGEGTDHAYAGQNFVLGGKIRGGKIYNEYPESLLAGNNQDLGRGRLLPRYPLENMYVPVAEWMGLNSTDLMTPFRNLNNFNSSQILSTSTLFRD